VRKAQNKSLIIPCAWSRGRLKWPTPLSPPRSGTGRNIGNRYFLLDTEWWGGYSRRSFMTRERTSRECKHPSPQSSPPRGEEGLHPPSPRFRRDFATLRDQGRPPIRFCETNPFHFRGVFDASPLFTAIYKLCSRVCKWVRSGKTNPFWGAFLMGMCGFVTEFRAISDAYGIVVWGGRTPEPPTFNVRLPTCSVEKSKGGG
jgi:hypothetical protein